MKKIDARKLTPRELSNLRRMVVRMREEGYSNNEVAKIVGLPYQTTSQYYSEYKKRGEKFFKVKSAGRPKGSNKKLTKEQERRIINLLIDKTPQELKFKFALWTRESVKALIDREFNINMPISTVGEYLKRWQFTSKKPIKRAYERNKKRVKEWIEKEYPKIKKEAKKDNADIWWGDETSCVSLPNNLKGYAPIGSKNKPILKHLAKRFKINMISAITNRGKSMFSLYEESINSDRFLDFLKKVIDSNSKKVYMILDNLKVHHSKKVKKWVDEHKDKIKLFYLPSYSPDLNPDEYLNQDYKQSANKNKIPKDKEELKNNTINYMLSLQKNPKKVIDFFKHPSVKYAA